MAMLPSPPPPRGHNRLGWSSHGLLLAAILILPAAITGCRNRQERFEELYRRAQATNVTETAPALKGFYPELVAKLNVEEYVKIIHIVAEHGHWYAARQLDPYLDKTHGEKRILIAAMVGMFSHGNHPGAVNVLKTFRKGDAPACSETVDDALLQIGDFREQWDRQDSQRLGISRQRWDGMSKEDRWKAIRDSDDPGLVQ